MQKKSKHVSEGLRETTGTYGAADARRNFFRILSDVSSGAVKSPVLIRHKTLADDVAMINAREFQQSQLLLKFLLKTRAGSFRLAGSMTVDGDVHDIIAEGRAEDAASSARRLRRL